MIKKIGNGRRVGRRGGAFAVLVALTISTMGVTPAKAAAPTVLAFLPLNGAPGTSVTITGLSFNDSSVATAVSFNGTAATFTVNSTLQITATVPAGAATGAISVTDSEGTGTSLLPFTVTASPAPTLTSFAPLTGPVGTSVTLTGTGFTGATSVKFNGTSATFTVGSVTQITTSVPAGATTGTISVTTPGGTATSPAPFTVTGGPASTLHARKLTLAANGTTLLRGRLSSAGGPKACRAKVSVKIQRRAAQSWKTVATLRTRATGKFSKAIARPGKYRALAPRAKVNGGADICAKSVSRPRRWK